MPRMEGKTIAVSPEIIFSPFKDVLGHKVLAVAVSGGPDSMALATLLGRWLSAHGWGGALHILTVDHGLRSESAGEAQMVGRQFSRLYPFSVPVVLSWQGPKPDSRVQEESRTARYALMENYCEAHGIRYLFLAHHQDDQAETFLMRLAAGSGLDGLAGMAVRQAYKNIILVRPCLDIPKTALIAFCREENIAYAEDPSNHRQEFARVRLRKAAGALGREGLTNKRLSLTARRLARAREMLEKEAEKFLSESLINKDSDRFVFNKDVWMGAHEEMVFRAARSVFYELAIRSNSENNYGPRTERVEALVDDLLKSAPFRKRTLGGVIVWSDDKKGEIVFMAEPPKKQ